MCVCFCPPVLNRAGAFDLFLDEDIILEQMNSLEAVGPLIGSRLKKPDKKKQKNGTLDSCLPDASLYSHHEAFYFEGAGHVPVVYVGSEVLQVDTITRLDGFKERPTIIFMRCPERMPTTFMITTTHLSIFYFILGCFLLFIRKKIFWQIFARSSF